MPENVLEVHVSPRSLAPFEAVIGAHLPAEARTRLAEFSGSLDARAVWNVSLSAGASCVSDAIGCFVSYARGAGVDARWLALEPTREFSTLQTLQTRMRHCLAGMRGESPSDSERERVRHGDAFSERERARYEDAFDRAAGELAPFLRSGDVVILHDPETAGLAPRLRRQGVSIVWRCHHAGPNPEAARPAWAFLAPHLQHADVCVFSRSRSMPVDVRLPAVVIAPPALDPFCAKNESLDDETCRALLADAGIVEGPRARADDLLRRSGGSHVRGDRGAEVVRSGPAPKWDTPLVAQITTWDRLEEAASTLLAFERLLREGETPQVLDAALVVAGPAPDPTRDGAECTAIFDELCSVWRELPDAVRSRVQLVRLPVADADQHAALVNALQRHAAVIVERNACSGCGLGAIEAMWKHTPVVAHAVGGLHEQIQDGTNGILIKDPADQEALAEALARVLLDPDRARRLGRTAHDYVRRHFLEPRGLLAQTELLGLLLLGLLSHEEG